VVPTEKGDAALHEANPLITVIPSDEPANQHSTVGKHRQTLRFNYSDNRLYHQEGLPTY